MGYKYNKLCDVCGSDAGIRFNSKANKHLCCKHYGQFIRYGYFRDNNKRTINDLNDISINSETQNAYIDLYDTCGNVIFQAIIDAEDVDKVKNIKWRATIKRRKTYVICGRGKEQQYLSRFLLGYNGDLEVDHIDGNELNNKKCNLRIVTRQENILNLKVRYNSQTQIRGVSYDKTHNTYIVDFLYYKNRFYFKPFKTLEEATYLRYLCETTYLKDFRNMDNNHKIMDVIEKLTSEKRKEIEEYFHMKIQNKRINNAS